MSNVQKKMVAYQEDCMPYSYLMLIIKILGSYKLWFWS